MGGTKENFRAVVEFTAAGASKTQVFQPLANGVVPEKWEVSVDNKTNGTASVVISWRDSGVSVVYADSTHSILTTEADDLGSFMSGHDEMSITVASAGGDMGALVPVVVRVTAGPEIGGVNAGGYGGYGPFVIEGTTDAVTWDAAGFEVLPNVT